MKGEKAIKQNEIGDPYTRGVINILCTHSYIVSHQGKLFRRHGITPEQFNVLLILRSRQPGRVSVSSIQERMLNKMSNASRLVEKLKQKGLVYRGKSASDRRQAEVSITAEGLGKLKDLEAEIHQLNKTMLHLNLEEVNALNELLDRLRS